MKGQAVIIAGPRIAENAAGRRIGCNADEMADSSSLAVKQTEWGRKHRAGFDLERVLLSFGNALGIKVVLQGEMQGFREHFFIGVACGILHKYAWQSSYNVFQYFNNKVRIKPPTPSPPSPELK